MKLQQRLDKLNEAVPEYQAEKAASRAFPKKRVVCSALVIMFLSAVYLPPLLFEEYTAANDTDQSAVQCDENAILLANQHLKDNPDKDFDGDGISNAEEVSRGSDPYRIDTDGDGLSDYAEVYITDTNPIFANNELNQMVLQELNENNAGVSAPFKVNNVVLWADDLASRTNGSVVRTPEGYRICNFSGWAQFPEGRNVYQYKDGIHYALRYNRDGAVYVSGELIEVRAFLLPLEESYQMNILGIHFNIQSEIASNVLNFLLPDHGPAIIYGKKVASGDIYLVSESKSNDIYLKDHELDNTRFERNHIMLSDLGAVITKIEDGECVIVSLFSPDRGEYVGIIYGMTSERSLLIADYIDLKSVGELKIEERASRIFDQSERILQYEWYLFQGLGFDSSRGDRISFINY